MALELITKTNGDGDPFPDGDRNTKKVRFKKGFDGEVAAMAVDSYLTLNLSWKDKLLGRETVISGPDCNVFNEGSESELKLLEGDVSTTMVNGIPTIAFSDRIKKILFKKIELTVVLKLLSRSIGYNALHNHILSLWKPTKPFHLMDIPNDYFLVRFKDNEYYNRVLTQGPWILYGQYYSTLE
ncbi:hypothetical protein PVK06_020561 [Gossypium arboreum]|uniref:DUF4283 domain-containing protein n=1 Tax=Gossypium arboreum TaxID=29729 RepID=A0ABR0PMN9_GOSAR|nr:hypothetical protein PVK06_020561 [Gossypium arboreum]